MIYQIWLLLAFMLYIKLTDWDKIFQMLNMAIIKCGLVGGKSNYQENYFGGWELWEPANFKI